MIVISRSSIEPSSNRKCMESVLKGHWIPQPISLLFRCDKTSKQLLLAALKTPEEIQGAYQLLKRLVWLQQ